MSIEQIAFYVIVSWLAAITGYLIFGNTTFKAKGRVKVPKPPKPFICPHGKISTLKQYVIKGQKKTLCLYCYHKEEGGQDVLDLPRL